MTANVWFFGCWNEPGHHWWRPNRDRHDYRDEPPIRWIDGGFAPRRWMDGRHRHRDLVKDPTLCWATEGLSDDDRRRISYDAEEYAQGVFLVHDVIMGRAIVDQPDEVKRWTIMSWWDRCQGDTRGACNSNLVVEGRHDTTGMLMLLSRSFTHVLENLRKHDVPLVWAAERQ